MNCEQAQELFSDYISQELSRDWAVSLENHLHSCAGCREEVVGLRETWTTLEAMHAVEPPAFFHENLMSRIAAEQAKAEAAAERRHSLWDPTFWFRPRALALAGAAALLLLLLTAPRWPGQVAWLNPFSFFWTRPAPKAPFVPPTVRAEWKPSPQGGGMIMIHLTPVPGTTPTKVNYRLRLNDNQYASGELGIFDGMNPVSLSLLMEKAPDPDALAVTWSAEGAPALNPTFTKIDFPTASPASGVP